MRISAAHLKKRLEIVAHDPRRPACAPQALPRAVSARDEDVVAGLYVPGRYSSNADAAARRAGVSLLSRFNGFTHHNRANTREIRSDSGIDADKRVEFGDTSLASVQSLVGAGGVEHVVGHFPDSAAALSPASCRFAWRMWIATCTCP